MVAWDFEMTLLPAWASAIYAMYHVASWFGTMLSVLVLSWMFLMRNEALKAPPGRIHFQLSGAADAGLHDPLALPLLRPVPDHLVRQSAGSDGATVAAATRAVFAPVLEVFRPEIRDSVFGADISICVIRLESIRSE